MVYGGSTIVCGTGFWQPPPFDAMSRGKPFGGTREKGLWWMGLVFLALGMFILIGGVIVMAVNAVNNPKDDNSTAGLVCHVAVLFLSWGMVSIFSASGVVADGLARYGLMAILAVWLPGMIWALYAHRNSDPLALPPGVLYTDPHIGYIISADVLMVMVTLAFFIRYAEGIHRGNMARKRDGMYNV